MLTIFFANLVRNIIYCRSQDNLWRLSAPKGWLKCVLSGKIKRDMGKVRALSLRSMITSVATFPLLMTDCIWWHPEACHSCLWNYTEQKFTYVALSFPPSMAKWKEECLFIRGCWIQLQTTGEVYSVAACLFHAQDGIGYRVSVSHMMRSLEGTNSSPSGRSPLFCIDRPVGANLSHQT